MRKSGEVALKNIAIQSLLWYNEQKYFAVKRCAFWQILILCVLLGDETMAQQVLNLTCPGCGAPIEVGMEECPYGHPITISTFNSVYSMPLPMVNKYANTYKKKLNEDPTDMQSLESIAFCYLKLKFGNKTVNNTIGDYKCFFGFSKGYCKMVANDTNNLAFTKCLVLDWCANFQPRYINLYLSNLLRLWSNR